MSKYEILKQLPKKLANLTWSCRRPNQNQPCNRCHSCVAKNKVINLIAVKENTNKKMHKLIPVPTLQKIIGKNETLIYDSRTGEKIIIGNEALKVIDACKGGAKYNDLIKEFNCANIESFLEKLVEKQFLIPSGQKPVKINLIPTEKSILNGGLISNLRLNVSDSNVRKCDSSLNCAFNVYRNRRMMSWHVAKLSIEKFLSLLQRNQRKRLSIVFSGDEAFLNWKLIEQVLLYLSERDLSGFKSDYLVYTNGTLMTDKIASKLKDHNVRVNVSLDVESHQQNTLSKSQYWRQSLEIIDKNITKMLKRKCQINIEVMLPYKNYYYFTELIDYISSKANKTEIAMSITLKALCGGDKRMYNKLGINDFFLYLNDSLQYAKKKNVIIENGMLYFPLTSLMNRSHIRGYCVGNGSELSVDPAGNVYSCVASNIRLGNIYKLDNVFKSREYQRLVCRTPGNVKECDRCKIEAFCLGGCLVNKDYTIKEQKKRNVECTIREIFFETMTRNLILA